MQHPEMAYGQIRFSTDEQLRGFKRALDEAPFLFTDPELLRRMVELEMTAREGVITVKTNAYPEAIPPTQEPPEGALEVGRCAECKKHVRRGRKYCGSTCSNKVARRAYKERQSQEAKKKSVRKEVAQMIVESEAKKPEPPKLEVAAEAVPARTFTKVKKGCATCKHGLKSEHATNGYACGAWKAMTCKPGTLNKFWDWKES